MHYIIKLRNNILANFWTVYHTAKMMPILFKAITVWHVTDPENLIPFLQSHYPKEMNRLTEDAAKFRARFPN